MRLIYPNRPYKEFFFFLLLPSPLNPPLLLYSSIRLVVTSAVVALLLPIFVFSGIFGRALGSLRRSLCPTH